MADGAVAGNGDGLGHLRQAEMDLEGAARVDQRGVGISSVQRPGTAEGARGVGLGVSGAERKMVAILDGDVNGGALF